MSDKQGEVSQEQRVWERGWEGHELEQLRRMSRWSLSQKLKWLEEAHRMVIQMQPSQQDRTDAQADPGPSPLGNDTRT